MPRLFSQISFVHLLFPIPSPCNEPSGAKDMLHSSILPHEDLWRRCVLPSLFDRSVQSSDRLDTQVLTEFEYCCGGRTTLLFWFVGDVSEYAYSEDLL
jgi:hypothetical protein